MTEAIIQEFLAICAYLRKSGHRPEKGYYVVSKEVLTKLLNQNKYLPVTEKLKIWKALNWIDADENHMTKRLAENGKYVRKIKIYASVYEELDSLAAKKINGEKSGH